VIVVELLVVVVTAGDDSDDDDSDDDFIELPSKLSVCLLPSLLLLLVLSSIVEIKSIWRSLLRITLRINRNPCSQLSRFANCVPRISNTDAKADTNCSRNYMCIFK
jgi:hypothetical protein